MAITRRLAVIGPLALLGWTRVGLPAADALREGHKTGMYLDQQSNYQAVAAFARGANVLDCFSFLGGFLVVGFLVVLMAALANIFFAIPAFSLAISAAVIFIMSGFILYDTSRIINGGETNYIMATVGLYLSIYNIFVHLLHLLSAFGGDD